MKYLVTLSLLALLLGFAACSEDEENPSVDVALLTGTSERTWKIVSRKFMNVEECLGTCELNYHKMKFTTDKELIFSTYTCMTAPCNSGTSSSDGGTLSWTLNGNMLNIMGFEFEILTLTQNTFEWKSKTPGIDLHETYTLVANEPFPDRTEMIAGTSQKTWKYEKRVVNETEIALTDCLRSARFTNYTNGALTTWYTNEACGVTTEGSWQFADWETQYHSIRSDGSTIEFDLLELTPARMVIGYTNMTGAYVVLYQVPE
ncbi:MAG: hypothetical protein KIT62_16495 [Cyclobacteriaceae bacterium]|nr:hypothetical protein [Cyclobacteriaceae bacterium]